MIEGIRDVLEKMRRHNEAAIKGAELGLKKAALHLVARAKALAPEDTRNLVMSIHSSGQVERRGDTMVIRVGCLAMDGAENYGQETHEDMEYDGPNVGGTRTQRRGPITVMKGTSSVEPADGSAGGKYLERPIRTATQVYADIIVRTVRYKLERAGSVAVVDEVF